MIYDSYIWKQDLKKELVKFKKFIYTTKIQVKPPESNKFFLRIEKFFFVTAYVIRKLNEANKLSDELVSTTLPIVKYPRKNKDKRLDFLNYYYPERFFDYKNKQEMNLNCLVLCNYLIHSFIFNPIFDEKEWNVIGIQVTSDKSKLEALYYITLNDYFKFLEQIISDNIVKVSFSRITGTYKKSRKK